MSAKSNCSQYDDTNETAKATQIRRILQKETVDLNQNKFFFDFEKLIRLKSPCIEANTNDCQLFKVNISKLIESCQNINKYNSYFPDKIKRRKIDSALTVFKQLSACDFENTKFIVQELGCINKIPVSHRKLKINTTSVQLERQSYNQISCRKPGIETNETGCSESNNNKNLYERKDDQGLIQSQQDQALGPRALAFLNQKQVTIINEKVGSYQFLFRLATNLRPYKKVDISHQSQQSCENKFIKNRSRFFRSSLPSSFAENDEKCCNEILVSDENSEDDSSSNEPPKIDLNGDLDYEDQQSFDKQTSGFFTFKQLNTTWQDTEPQHIQHYGGRKSPQFISSILHQDPEIINNLEQFASVIQNLQFTELYRFSNTFKEKATLATQLPLTTSVKLRPSQFVRRFKQNRDQALLEKSQQRFALQLRHSQLHHQDSQITPNSFKI